MSIPQRFANQDHRIQQGIQSGRLTGQEATELYQQQGALMQEYAQALSDGKLSPEERQKLTQGLNGASQNIYGQKHDGQNALNTPGIDQRLANQDRRIEQGIKSGQLTPEEAAKLKGEVQMIRDARAAAKSDGRVSMEERQNMRQMLNASSKDIYEAKHNCTKNPYTGQV
ncbi:MAG: hypothetical protein U1E65_17775 [Myxococcota bacterium]